MCRHCSYEDPMGGRGYLRRSNRTCGLPIRPFWLFYGPFWGEVLLLSSCNCTRFWGRVPEIFIIPDGAVRAHGSTDSSSNHNNDLKFIYPVNAHWILTDKRTYWRVVYGLPALQVLPTISSLVSSSCESFFLDRRRPLSEFNRSQGSSNTVTHNQSMQHLGREIFGQRT